MQQPQTNSAVRRAPGARVIAAAVAVASLSGAGALTLFAGVSNQTPPPVRTANIHLVTTNVPAATTTAPAPAPTPSPQAPAAETPTTVTTPAPPSPGAPAPAPADAARVNNDKGGFSYLVPQGWTQADSSRLTYGSALLTNPAAPNGSILLGRLDLKLFAGAEQDNGKASIRLASDMGEFFMPYPGNRVNQENQTFEVAGMSAASSYYEVKFDDTTKESGQIWAAAVGSGKDRWFVVWLGTTSSPVDKGLAKSLAQSIRPWTPPAQSTPTDNPPPPADPNQPPPPPGDPNQPPPPSDTPAPAAPVAPGQPAPAPASAPPAAPAAPGQPAAQSNAPAAPAPGMPV